MLFKVQLIRVRNVVLRFSSYVYAMLFKVQLIWDVRQFIRATFFDNWCTLRWSPIVLYVARCLHKNEDIPTTAEFMNEICC